MCIPVKAEDSNCLSHSLLLRVRVNTLQVNWIFLWIDQESKSIGHGERCLKEAVCSGIFLVFRVFLFLTDFVSETKEASAYCSFTYFSE